MHNYGIFGYKHNFALFIRWPKELSEKSRKIIDSQTNLFICDGVFAEIIYVLTKVYKVERILVKQTLSKFLQKSNINVSNKNLIIKSLEIFESKNIDYIDSLLCSYNHLDNITIKTFDKKLKKYLK